MKGSDQRIFKMNHLIYRKFILERSICEVPKPNSIKLLALKNELENIELIIYMLQHQLPITHE
jgi:hypothetical protein